MKNDDRNLNATGLVQAMRVLVVDDQISVRQLVAEQVVLKGEGTRKIVAEAASGIDGLSLFRELLPDLVIAALALPELNGAEMVKIMREERPQTKVMIYTGTRNPTLIASGLETRPHGFVHKTDPLSMLHEAIGAVTKGACFFSPYATQFFDSKGNHESSPGCRLTAKEKQILQLVSEGLGTKQVAAKIFISPKTVEHYRSAIMKKLGLRDIASLTRYAVRNGIVSEY